MKSIPKKPVKGNEPKKPTLTKEQAKAVAAKLAENAEASKFKSFVAAMHPGIASPFLNPGFIILRDETKGLKHAYAVLNIVAFSPMFTFEQMKEIRNAIVADKFDTIHPTFAIVGIDGFMPDDAVTIGSTAEEVLGVYLYSIYSRFGIGSINKTKMDLCNFVSNLKIFFNEQAVNKPGTSIIMLPHNVAPHALKASNPIYFLHDMETSYGGRIVVRPSSMNTPIVVDPATFRFWTEAMNDKSARIGTLARVIGSGQSLVEAAAAAASAKTKKR